VTDSNKQEYIRLVCQMMMTGAIRKKMAAFLEGFYDMIPLQRTRAELLLLGIVKGTITKMEKPSLPIAVELLKQLRKSG
jgi:hypothetical protein